MSFLNDKPRLFLSIKCLLAFFIIAVLGTISFFLWQQYYPVVAAKKWQYRVLHTDVERASAVYKQQDGSLIVAEELNKKQGRIIHIATDDTRTVLFKDLDKPDGITPFNGGIVFSQEGGIYPVSFFKNGKLQTLFEGTNVQGLTVDGQYLYAVEDRGENSQILRYDSKTKELEVIRSGLNEAETLAICPDGKKYYNEKDKSRVKLLTDDGADPIILNYKKTRYPSILKCDDKGLWISEDSTHRARLLLLKPNGKLKVILNYLKAPQQLLKVGADKYILAEGGRDRLLEIEKIN